MNIQIREHDIEVTETLRVHVTRRIGFALGRFVERIDWVAVRFSESKRGHGAGADKRCQIHVALNHSASATIVEQTHADLFAAVDLAAGRVSRAVARVLDRGRQIASLPDRAMAR